jgi:aspartyl-tRNA(Asn)/glutamyl-tRNA(Gln) amidotransferase subunit C
MPHEIGVAEVERIAALARLDVSDEEKALFAGQLTRILEYAQQIAALDTTGVSPTARVDGGAPLERPDEPRPSLARDVALQNAPDSLAGLFVVPRAIHEDD